MILENYFILACDEHGSIARLSSNKSWLYGGIIFRSIYIHDLTSTWNNIKYKLCGNTEVELKWRDFFLDEKDSPLLSKENIQEQINWAISTLFSSKRLLTPLAVRVPKNRASDLCYKLSSKNNEILDIEVLLIPLYSQFYLFLKLVSGFGEIWFDKLGSEKEESRRQRDWEQLRNNYGDKQKLLSIINKKLLFLDSKSEPTIQVADFITGAIYAASEGNEQFIELHLNSIFPKQYRNICLVTIQ